MTKEVGYGYDNGMGVFAAAGEQGKREALKEIAPVLALMLLFSFLARRKK